MSPAAVAVVGSCNMDLVVSGGRIPAAGETVHARQLEYVCGGKGLNQAVAAARAGARTPMVAAVGDDPFGQQIRAAMSAAGVDVDAVRTVNGPSGCAVVTVDDSGENSISVVPGANGSLVALTSADAALIRRADVLLLQLEVPMPAVVAAARVASDAGVRVVLTPSPAQSLGPELLDNVDLVVANHHEVRLLSGDDNLESGLRALLRSVPAVVVTRGSLGCVALTRAGDRCALPACQVQAVDSTAAGDTFAGALAVGLAEGLELRVALARATVAAALSVQRPGASASIPTRDEIDALYAREAARLLAA